ncbi:MAG: CoA transferase, partial [Pollutimonas bauzanensis]
MIDRIDMTTALTALNDLLAAAGMPPAIARQADLTGGDPVFPTPYRIAAAGAAAIAAAALASAELWRLRTGRAQRVGVDARAAAASLRGHKYLKVNGVNPQTRDTITRYYQLKDGGWIYLHNNFPHLRERNLRVLGARHDADNVA